MAEEEIDFEAELRLTLEGRWNREEEEYTVEQMSNPEIGEIIYKVHGEVSDEDTRKLRKGLLDDFKSVGWIVDVSSALRKGDTDRLKQIADEFTKG